MTNTNVATRQSDKVFTGNVAEGPILSEVDRKKLEFSLEKHKDGLKLLSQ
ncbi:hypothetical protein Mpt1_c08680 [Candidatus Methanoplasma termitum]|uniref:Uncharacterized protein n=1 Tax=Candidatus Methanoplasma termitum TaxID=1577791 RepID=A0A0A7LCF1_9ARCH|nr:hypothetical protein Mpt1_c08680 [Candidatus Methanoplasma termitum]